MEMDTVMENHEHNTDAVVQGFHTCRRNGNGADIVQREVAPGSRAPDGARSFVIRARCLLCSIEGAQPPKVRNLVDIMCRNVT
jgi:hypothetical protein